MARFEVSINGAIHEIEAPDAQAAALALQHPEGLADAKTGAPLQPTSGAEWGEALRRAGSGVVQLAGYFGGSQQQQDSYAKQEDARRAAFKAKEGEGADTSADLLSGLVPTGIGAGAANESTSLIRTLARRMATGGAVSATQYVPEGGSRAENVALGAATGGAVHATVGLLPRIKNIVTNAITDGEKNPRVAAAVKDAQDFFQGSDAVKTPAPYTIGQATASPNVASVEKLAFGPKQQELYATQADQAAARFQELAGRAQTVSKLDTSSQGVANAVNDTLNTTVMGMRGTRSAAFKAGMSEVLAAAGPGGGPGVVPLTNLSNAYQDILKEDANAFNIHGPTLPQGVMTAAGAVAKATTLGSKIKVPTIQYLLQGLGQDAPHGAGAFLANSSDARLEMYRNRLRTALDKDIDSAGVTAASNPAFAKLLDVRKTYAQQSQALRTVEDGTLNRLFGNPAAIATPGQALDKFYSMRPADQQAAVSLLQNNHPEVLDAMRANRIRTAVTDATTAGAAKNSAFDLATFNESMFGGDKANSPLFGGDAVSQQMRAGAAHLRVLLNTARAGGGSPIAPSDVAINLVSLTPAFIARQVARALTGTSGDRLLGTPEGLAALRTLSVTSGRKSAATAQALAYVMGLSQQPQQPPSEQPAQ